MPQSILAYALRRKLQSGSVVTSSILHPATRSH
jgi:hypothetical protein